MKDASEALIDGRRGQGRLVKNVQSVSSLLSDNMLWDDDKDALLGLRCFLRADYVDGIAGCNATTEELVCNKYTMMSWSSPSR